MRADETGSCAFLFVLLGTVRDTSANQPSLLVFVLYPEMFHWVH